MWTSTLDSRCTRSCCTLACCPAANRNCLVGGTSHQVDGAGCARRRRVQDECKLTGENICSTTRNKVCVNCAGFDDEYSVIIHA